MGVHVPLTAASAHELAQYVMVQHLNGTQFRAHNVTALDE